MKHTNQFVYILQTRDDKYKSRLVFKNEFVTTSKKELASKIVELIIDKKICFMNKDFSTKDQVVKFKEYWKKYDCYEGATSISHTWSNQPVSTEVNSLLISANVESWNLSYNN